MPGLFGILEIGKRGLASQQLAMNVIGHNIANAATPGYSRQRAGLVPTLPLRNAQGLFVGTGVEIDTINRVRDRFLDTQYRQANGSFGSAAMRQGVLGQIEAVLSEPGDSGLQSAMDKFFNSFQALSLHPEDSGPRDAVLTQANQLVSTFSRITSGLTTQQSNLADDAANKVSQVNSLSQRIAQLNQQIVTARGAGNEPSDLMDQRDAAIDQLSRITNITASQDSQGVMLVSIGGTLVATNGTSFALQSKVTNGTLRITDASGQDVQVTGGDLGGMLALHNTAIPGYRADLDTLANALITRVNAVQSAGYGLGNPPPTGISFFTGTNAGNIAVNIQISSNTSNIAASSDGAPGDNRNALALYGIMNERLMDSGTTTVTQYYSRFVSTVGSAVVSATGDQSGFDLVLSQIDAQRESVSGVSLDEEMTNMIKFQRSFDAAARLVKTADDLLQTIINLV